MSRDRQKRPISSGSSPLPRGWEAFFENDVPAFVKNRYSPKSAWKDRPFSMEDARFFSKGVIELSELFTLDRADRLPNYFSHPRFRSAYLLYFLPLQAAKVAHLWQSHPTALEAFIEQARSRSKTNPLRILDLGSGPGTASFATLLVLLEECAKRSVRVPAVRLTWVDRSRDALRDGEGLLEQFRKRFQIEVELTPVASDWLAGVRGLEAQDFTVLAHTLNESPDSRPAPKALEVLDHCIESSQSAGVLLLEPASRPAAHRLAHARDALLTRSPELPARSLYGPCLHLGGCPLSTGRDWCHFSRRTEIPGKWFRSLSRALGSERDWLKYSYVWFASPSHPAPPAKSSERRVLSDPMAPGPRAGGTGGRAEAGSRNASVLLCEPDRVFRMTGSRAAKLRRGDIVDLNAPTPVRPTVSAGPLSGGQRRSRWVKRG